jgi:starvation-inducible DNA-binding protein
MSKNKVEQGLAGLQADLSVLSRKVKNYHWNVRGRDFFTLHAQFEALYDQLAEFMDQAAERLVALGHRPLPGLAADLERASLKEEAGFLDPMKMVGTVLADLEQLSKTVMAVQDAANEADDRVTANMLDDFLDAFAAKSWMLRAFAS